MNIDIISNIAAIISGFGTAVLIFRIQRETKMDDEGEITWLPLSDNLLLFSIFITLFLVLLPILVVPLLAIMYLKVLRSLLALCIILATGYIFAILAHYRIILSGDRTGPRTNPEPPERIIFFLSIALGVFIFGLTLLI